MLQLSSDLVITKPQRFESRAQGSLLVVPLHDHATQDQHFCDDFHVLSFGAMSGSDPPFFIILELPVCPKSRPPGVAWSGEALALANVEPLSSGCNNF